MCVLLFVLLFYKYMEYDGYSIEVADTAENTLVYSYYPMNGNVLKCASDSVILSNRHDETLWTVSYDMSSPGVDICGNYAAIYDENGTSIVVCGDGGEVGSIRTDLPIVKAEVSSIGTVCAILDDGSDAEIAYYSLDGSLIAVVQTTMESDGYPMDIALSNDGMVMGVSYLSFRQGAEISQVVFYGFDDDAQTASDNIIGSFTYENEIIAELSYIEGGRFVSFGIDAMIVYEGTKSVEERTVIEAEDEIKSVFSSGGYFGYIIPGNDNSGYEIVVYNSGGNERTRIETDFTYTSFIIYDEILLLYNRNEMEVYTLGGILKFSGEVEGLLRQACPLGSNRFALAATDAYYVVRLG